MNSSAELPDLDKPNRLAFPKAMFCPECHRIVSIVGKGVSAKFSNHNYEKRSRWNLYGPTGRCPGGGVSALPTLISAARGELDAAVKKLEAAASAHHQAAEDALKVQKKLAMLEGLDLGRVASG